jgi:hypothetical protein
MAVRQQAVTGARHADAGTVRTGVGDIAGLLLTGEQYGVPYDLLAAALDVQSARLHGGSWAGGGRPDTLPPAT